MKRIASVLAATLALASCGDREAGSFDLQAHRGGRGETTEESLRAFSKALELGVSTLELDIVISRDRKPMVWHDPAIAPEKCSDTGPVTPADPQFPYVGKLVKDLTSEQLHTLDCGKLLKDFPRAEVVGGNRIALLSEVFALADSYHADVRYNIEAKVEAAEPHKSAEPQVFVDIILDTVRAAGRLDKVEIQSFDWRTLWLTARAEPGVPLVALWDETTWYPGSPWLGGVEPAIVKDPIDGAKLVGAAIVSPGYAVPYGGTVGDPGFTLVAGKKFIDKAHALGLKVIPWTINDAETMKAQIDAGADGIISDYPTILRAVMAEKGLPLPPAYHR